MKISESGLTIITHRVKLDYITYSNYSSLRCQHSTIKSD